MHIVDPAVEAYMRELQERHDEPVLLEMERYAIDNRFPIVDRLVGATLELLARAIGARRIIELGSGFGYSGYWFSRAVGEGGELHLTDSEEGNADRARDYLSRAGLSQPLRFHVGEAVSILNSLDGGFDIVYNDIDKDGYPGAWASARDRIRVGGMYICDNVLWSGRVTGQAEDPQPRWTAAIDEHNRLIAVDPDYLSVIVPTRDGVMVALRLH